MYKMLIIVKIVLKVHITLRIFSKVSENAKRSFEVGRTEWLCYVVGVPLRQTGDS